MRVIIQCPLPSRLEIAVCGYLSRVSKRTDCWRAIVSNVSIAFVHLRLIAFANQMHLINQLTLASCLEIAVCRSRSRVSDCTECWRAIVSKNLISFVHLRLIAFANQMRVINQLPLPSCLEIAVCGSRSRVSNCTEYWRAIVSKISISFVHLSLIAFANQMRVIIQRPLPSRREIAVCGSRSRVSDCTECWRLNVSNGLLFYVHLFLIAFAS